MKLLVGLAFLALCHISATERSPTIIPVEGGATGYAQTTLSWNCCPKSCSKDEFVHTNNKVPVQSCQKDGVTPSTEDNNGNSACQDGGTAYSCSNQAPYVVNSTLAFGFASGNFQGRIAQCCTCILLSFRGQLAGKQMLVQLTSTGYSLLQDVIGIDIPGSGVGVYTTGCSSQWDLSENGWGDRFSGVSTVQGCKQLPTDLQEGCRIRFDFMEGDSRPDVTYTEVKCPAELINISKCGDLD